ncbi:hypothetical protein N7532_012006 [Penicillium argentinense]|uniref:Major facilitator superfamily (MFS) profile domain-containing protein n=1 Tax=Penicillium argentinense TaxID=1131581 RepID=A0A9W9JVD2_9EURO|nr:uncharacterized protein N7532_012006 [Penicillium argentinense]KAJ5082963.1 hypothetical protein N7532_012006 [Penicillium argentinense]
MALGWSLRATPLISLDLSEIHSCPLSNKTPSDVEKGGFTQTVAEDDSLIMVGWDGPNDPLNPANASVGRKLFMTFLVSLIAISVTAASAIDASGVLQYSEYFNVSEVAGSLATGLFLVGFGAGSLLSGPFSETFGRNVVYLITMLLFLIFIMASALAPTLHSHLIFRFFAGFFGSTPLSCAGGTVADLWDPAQKAYAFPAYAIPAFAGPMIGQIIGSYIPTTLGWRWLEWIMLIMGGAILMVVILLQPETYGNLLLHWKAKILRQETGNQRYRAPMEMKRESLGRRLLISIYRPFLLFYSELILILMSLYLTVVYIVLFTFLEGYTFIFTDTYGVSQGITSVTWAGMLCGILLVSCIVPVVYSWTAKEYQKTSVIAPETRLWYAMLGGAPAVPISLFWMGWTCNPIISIWSPLIASALFGYGITTIFIVAYMYIIDSYGVYSASALGFLVFTRYVVAGGVTVAGTPIYRAIGVQYTLTILGSTSGLMAFIPYLLFFYGPQIRKYSKYAVNTDKKNDPC